MLNSLTVLGPSSPALVTAGLVDRNTGPTCWASQGLTLSQYRQRPETTLPRGHGPVASYSLNSPTVPSTTRRAHTPPLVTLQPPPVSPKAVFPQAPGYPNREQGERPRHLRRS